METSTKFSRQDLPNATIILILGICSLAGCCLSYGIIGIICSIIALIMAKTANKLYESDPNLYTETSYKNMNAGKTCAIISLILSIIVIVLAIIAVISFGWIILTHPELYLNQSQVGLY